MGSVPFSSAEVLALSPDDASTKAARGLVVPSKWSLLGANDTAVWGQCQGSGSKPYQTQVDISGSVPSFRCTCPSRKFPCKHGLALLLLQAQDASLFTAQEPTWVTEWLASRKERAEKKEAKETAAPKKIDVEAINARVDQRLERMRTGAAELSLWLNDMLQVGLAGLSREQINYASTLAARMVDAQAPGLGQRLIHAMSLVGSNQDWPSLVLMRLGKLQLLLDALNHFDALPVAMQFDVRQALGWSVDKEEVLAVGEHVADEWQVLAVIHLEREGRLIERRIWLQGRQTRRFGLLVDFAHGSRKFEQLWQVGQCVLTSLVFFPGVLPLRVLCVERFNSSETSIKSDAPDVVAQQLEYALLGVAQLLAANPWISTFPFLLADAQLIPPQLEVNDDIWRLKVGATLLPICITPKDAWSCFAITGGMPLVMFGEWDGRAWHPLTAWSEQGIWQAENWREAQ